MSKEKRRKDGPNTKPSPLPEAFAEMVNDVFTANFEAGLKALKKRAGKPVRFSAHGRVHAEEIVLGISIVVEGQLAATTVHASVDFDPKASSPTVQDCLNACVDAAGSVYSVLLDPKSPEKLDSLLDQPLAALTGVPFDWTALEVEKRKVFLKVDKANPDLENAADDWLAKHDPSFRELEEEAKRETEKLFVTGKEPRNRSGGN